MDFFDINPIFFVLLSTAPNVIMLSILVTFLVRHFRASLLLMSIAQFVWLCISAYSQYLSHSGNVGIASDIWPFLNGISTVATIANVIGMALLLAEWGQLLRHAASQGSRSGG